MPEQNENLPKVPPFVIKGNGGNAAQGPVNPPPPLHRTPAKKNGQPSERGMLSLVVLLISLIGLGVAMLSGAKFSYDILFYTEDDAKPEQVTAEPEPTPDAQEQVVGEATPEAQATEEPAKDKLNEEEAEKPNKYEGAFSKIIVIGLAYIVGWLFTAYGIRVLGNLILPIFIKIYAWMILGGILVLQFAIIFKLFAQVYNFMSFVRYVSLFSAGLIALVGLHLVLQDHKLVFFGIPILLTSLAHLFLVVFHFVFMQEVQYEKLWGDLGFFAITTTVSMLMLAHFGILNGFRNYMDRTFNPKDNHFVPLE